MTSLELIDVTVERGGRTLLTRINARFVAGQLTAIIGPNGVGKSSLLATMCGAARPAAGRVLLGDRDCYRVAPRERARAIALVEPTEAVLAAMTVEESVRGARFPYHRWWEWHTTSDDTEAVERALAATDLTPLRRRELGTLSAGERQRVWLALALAQSAPIVALDEPTSHLDVHYAIDTLERLVRLARSGTTVIAVVHMLEEAAAFADRVIVFAAGGVIADGTPADALTEATLLAAYGVDIRVEAGIHGLAFFRKYG